MRDYLTQHMTDSDYEGFHPNGLPPGYTQHIKPQWHFFFGFFRKATADTGEPIFTSNTPKDAEWLKEVPLGGQKC